MVDQLDIQLAKTDLDNLSMRDPSKEWVCVVGAGAGSAKFLERIVDKLIKEKKDSVGFIVIDPRPPEDDGKGIAWTHNQSSGHYSNMHLSKIGVSIPTINEAFSRVGIDTSVDALLYKQRTEIGQHLHSNLLAVHNVARENGITINREVCKAVDLQKYKSGYAIAVNRGEPGGQDWIFCNHVVLALGHFPSTAFQDLKSQPNFIANPWDWDTINPSPDANTVGLLGAGPTAIDVLTVLREKGFDRRVESFSRSGFLQYPRPKYQTYERVVFTETNLRAIHAYAGPLKKEHIETLLLAEFESAGCNMDEILFIAQSIKEDARKSLAHGILNAQTTQDWFSILKSFDQITPLTWNLADVDCRNYYLGFIRKYHTAISYGMIEKQARRIHDEICENKFVVFSGLKNVVPEGSGFRLIFDNRGNEDDRYVDYLVNCTGVGSNLKSVRLPLIQNLLKKNILKPIPHGGAECDFDTGKLASHTNVANGASIYTLVGSLNYGTRLLTHCYGEVEASAERTAAALFDELRL